MMAKLVVRNKWNGRDYKKLDSSDNLVALERDGTQFTISKKEYYFNYIELVVDK